jgi:hypothetical protein
MADETRADDFCQLLSLPNIHADIPGIFERPNSIAGAKRAGATATPG